MTHLVNIVSNIATSGNWKQKNSQGKVAGENTSVLWHYLRYLDVSGAGKVSINLSEVCKFFERSPKQIKRWLNDGLRLGFFGSFYKLPLGNYVVYYKSTLSVAKALGLSNLGAIAQIPLDKLKDLRRYATKINVLAQQRATEYRQYSKKVSGYKLNIAEALNPCGIASRAILFRTKRYLVCHPSTQLIGGSQKSTARNMGRAEITIQRHLSDCSTFEKRQLATASKEHWIEVTKNKLAHKANLRIFKLDDWETPIKAFCNVYNFPEIEPRPQKFLRQKLKRILKNASLISSAYQTPEQTCSFAGGEIGHLKDNFCLSERGAE